MIRSYITVALRNLMRYKFFSAINVLGLAISMCICMAVLMLVADQLMYDRFNTNSARIFRIITTPVNNEGEPTGAMDNATSQMTLRDELLEKYTGIDKVVRLKRGFGNHWMEVEGQNINIPVKGYFADPEVFDFFQYEFEHGDRSTALKQPYTVVLTHDAARKLFKEDNPVGLTLEVGKDVYTITGVLKKTSNKSHIVFDGLASIATVNSMHAAGKVGNDMENWFDYWDGWTYIMTNNSKQLDEINSDLDKVFDEHIAISTNPDQYRAKFRLQPLLEITPGKFINNAIGPSMPWLIIYFLSALAAIIMITSCFNFTNLSIARALTRAREVGVRKVNGANRVQILTQFLTESILVAGAALALAYLLVFAAKPFMLQLNFAKIFQWDLRANLMVYIVLFVFAVLVGLLAGILPASLISGFQPVKVLKKIGDVRLFSRLTLRKSLIVAQFTMSLIFILTVTLLYNQLRLFQSKDHGFVSHNNMVIRLNGGSYEQTKNALSNISSVSHVSGVSHLPAVGETRGNGFKKELSDPEWTSINYFSADEDYLNTLSINLIAGKYFQAANAESNKNFIVMNETAARSFHFKSPSDAIGQQLIYQADSIKRTVIGIIPDYNHQVLFSKIEPMVILYNPSEFSYLHVKFMGRYDDLLKDVSKRWTSVNRESKLDASLLDDKIAGFYDMIFGDMVNVVGVVSLLAIFISCMGLMGMATYTTETRTKEVAIRKVLGSKDGQLVLMLSHGFLKLLGLAVLIGVPLAWLANGLWLDMLPYRTPFDFKVVAIGVTTMVILGGITVASQTLRAVFVNPAESLRSE